MTDKLFLCYDKPVELGDFRDVLERPGISCASSTSALYGYFFFESEPFLSAIGAF
jgi:hypothetical protein